MKFKNYLNKKYKNLEDFLRSNVMPLEDFAEKLENSNRDTILYYHNMWKEAKTKGYMNADFYLKEIEKVL